LKEDCRDRPIGIFDSGIGGLTVAREIMNTLPGESILYLGDTARVPYGIRSPETVVRYATESALFLLEKGVKILVVACNTVSAIGLERLESLSPVKVIGVLLPGVQAAVNSTISGRIGIIGTEATIRSGAYQKSILDLHPLADVFGLPCPLFVPIVEEGLLEGPITDLIVERYLRELKQKNVDTLVLGCTHYPLLKQAIRKFLGEDISLIDSAVETARVVTETLKNEGLLCPEEGSAENRFYVTDSPERFRRIGENFLGRKISNIEKVFLPEEETYLTKGGS
jgi:glutamate racemase